MFVFFPGYNSFSPGWMTACKDEACATKAQEEARAQRTWQETAAGSGGIFKQQHIVEIWFLLSEIWIVFGFFCLYYVNGFK